MGAYKKLRVGVVGVGYFGTFHALKAVKHPKEELVGIFDTNKQRLLEVASELNCKPYESLEELIADVDALYIATPATTHARVTTEAIQANRHVFIEKPIASSLEESDELMKLADKHRIVAHVGYLLRYSFERKLLVKYARSPMRLFFKRTTKQSHRGNDVSVVLDLMIHDLDYLTIFKDLGDLKEIVVSGNDEHATAKLTFSNGCIAEFFVDRNAEEAQQEIYSYTKEYALKIRAQNDEAVVASSDKLDVEELTWEKKDLLYEEHDSFVRSCLEAKSEGTSIASAMYAQELAEQILRLQD